MKRSRKERKEMRALYMHLLDRSGHGERSVTFAIEEKGRKLFGSGWQKEAEKLIFG